MALSRFERAALLRNDFYAFMQSCFHELHAQTPFLDNWHLELLAAKLEACRRGQCRRLIINVPPRSLKSLAASIAFPAWLLGHQPSAQIICASYAQDLADTHARHCRRVMASAAYRCQRRSNFPQNGRSKIPQFVVRGSAAFWIRWSPWSVYGV